MVLLDHGGRDAEKVEIVAPPSDLLGVAEHLWIDHRPGMSVSDWRIVPDASPYVIATVTASGRERAIRIGVVGARSCAADIDVRDRVLTVGLRLRPGALPALIDAPARELVDRSVPVSEVLPGSALRDSELGPEAPARLILQELIRVARRALRKGTVTTMPAGAATVAELASSLRSPVRSLLERTYRDVGLSPKRMLRVLRLHAALHAARRPGQSWADVACVAGFADQAHLTRELRALLGETPSAWKARGSADLFKTARSDAR